jgi:3-deoxy-D-manno-octulosonate 8-phosphate phosphatase (KDO 8-P phosphatase)
MLVDVALFDIDGILTDGKVYIDADGKETKRISYDDIDALFLFKKKGVKIGFITGEKSSFSDLVKKLYTPDFWGSGRRDKLACFKEMVEMHGIERARTSYAGDAKTDIELLSYLDYSFAPADVDEEVRSAAKYVLHASRGNGVIKEVAGFLLKETPCQPARLPLDFWTCRIREHIQVTESLLKDSGMYNILEKASELLVKALKEGRQVILWRQGLISAGSRCFSLELSDKVKEGQPKVRAKALRVSMAQLSKGDVILPLMIRSVSREMIDSIRKAREKGVRVILVTGNTCFDRADELSDLLLPLPSSSMYRLHEAYAMIINVLCEAVENELSMNPGSGSS